MEIVVSIVTYNSLAYLENLVSDLEQYVSSERVNIVFVDNGSTDGTVDYLKSLTRCSIHIIEGDNVGFGAGHNKVFRAFSSANYYLLLNPDCRIESRVVDDLLSFGPIDIAAPNVYSSDGALQKNSYCFTTPTRIVAYELGIKRLTSNFTTRQYAVAACRKSVDWISGCCMMISREVIDKVVGFDEEIFLYAEDEEFCWRAGRFGFVVEKLDVGRVVHYVGWKSNWNNPSVRRVMYVSHGYVYRKIYAERPLRRGLMLFVNWLRMKKYSFGSPS